MSHRTHIFTTARDERQFVRPRRPPDLDENERLAAIYGIEIRDGSLEILMRHRAFLLGILGAFFGYAAFVPALQPLAFLGAFLSLASFFYLTATVGDLKPAIRKLVIADVVTSAFLAGAVVLFVIK